LPTDLRRLAQNVLTLSYGVQTSMEEIWAAVDAATAAGHGAATLNLSPYGAIIDSLIRKFGLRVFDSLAEKREWVFVPDEIDLTGLPLAVSARIIRSATA
jgi:hypothetical protein